MCTPTTRDEYERRFQSSHKITGQGIAEVTIHVPCPACAAPDFLRHKLLDTETAWRDGSVCEECGRGYRAAITRTPLGGSRFEIIQWRGDPSPEWCPVRSA